MRNEISDIQHVKTDGKVNLCREVAHTSKEACGVNESSVVDNHLRYNSFDISTSL